MLHLGDETNSKGLAVSKSAEKHLRTDKATTRDVDDIGGRCSDSSDRQATRLTKDEKRKGRRKADLQKFGVYAIGFHA